MTQRHERAACYFMSRRETSPSADGGRGCREVCVCLGCLGCPSELADDLPVTVGEKRNGGERRAVEGGSVGVRHKGF